jgi:ribonuclease-3
MRPRFRSEPGPRSTREGRPLELVRVRGTQRDPGHDGRELKQRRRRRGGRRRAGGPKPPAPPAPKFSLPRWLASIFTRRLAAPAPVSISEQEAKVLREFSRHYGLTFKDSALLKLALSHRSYLSVTGGAASDSNERLEFLGDSVLGLVTSEHLFRTRPGEHEGQLTKTKSLLVSKAILSRRALAMGLGRFVLMSHSEIESGGRQRLSILADAFESVIGAIYLDLGFEASRSFIERWLLNDAPEIVADKRHVNYKSHLQEYVQSTFRTHPVYRIRSEMGPDHSKHFMVEVAAGRRVLGEGRGKNKKEAEQAAARHALDRVTETGRGELPVREGRGEPSRREETPPGRRTPPDSAPGPGIATEEEGMGPGRRRGRRGGRGRRRPEGMPPPGAPARTVEAEAPREAQGPVGTPRASGTLPDTDAPRPFAARGPAREPRAERPREPRVERAREPRIERPREIEPQPSAMDEDEIEEIGRPEGPPGERFVDPFASEAAARGGAGWEDATEAPERPRDDGGEREEEFESEAPAMKSFAQRRPPETEPEGADATGEAEEKRPEPSGTSRGGAPSYGRRRGRRNP